MVFSHENLEVYRQAIAFVAWSRSLTEELTSRNSLRAQLERASTSMPLNIAEGNAKSSRKDRARYWHIALGSTFEAAAILDVMLARGLTNDDAVVEGKGLLEQIAAMLMALLKSLGSMVAG